MDVFGQTGNYIRFRYHIPKNRYLPLSMTLLLMTSSLSFMESSCLALVLRFVISWCNLFNQRAKILHSARSWFGLPSKRNEEVDNPSVVDERVKVGGQWKWHRMKLMKLIHNRWKTLEQETVGQMLIAEVCPLWKNELDHPFRPEGFATPGPR